MKKLLLAIAAIFSIGTAYAQPSYLSVGPGVVPCAYTNCTVSSLTATGSVTATAFAATTGNLSFSTNNGGIVFRNGNTIFSSPATAQFQFGGGDTAAPVAQTLSFQNVVAGTSNTAGVNATIKGSQGTGTGVGGSLIFQTAPAGSTGSAQNALVTALTIDSTQKATLAGQLAVTNMTQTSAAQSGTVCFAAAGLTYDATLGCLASLEELKDIHAPINSALAEVTALKPFWFSWKKTTPEWKGGDRSVQPGLGARATEKVDPRLVAYGPDGKLRGVRYQEMVALLVASVQELKAANDNQAKRIAVLEKKLRK